MKTLRAEMYLRPMSNDTCNALLDVERERTRQIAKWGPDEQEHEDSVWLAIATEELGEVAQEVLTRVFGEAAGKGHGDLREEWVHVAAVAVAAIEDMDRRSDGHT